MESARRDYIDDFHAGSSQHPGLNQMLCFQCEEYISRSATACPYCHAKVASPDMRAQKFELPGTKLAEDAESSSAHSGQSLAYVASLCALLLGGSTLFLGILFPIIAEDGVVTLSWDESLWKPLLLLGLLSIFSGYYLLQRVEPAFAETEP